MLLVRAPCLFRSNRLAYFDAFHLFGYEDAIPIHCNASSIQLYRIIPFLFHSCYRLNNYTVSINE